MISCLSSPGFLLPMVSVPQTETDRERERKGRGEHLCSRALLMTPSPSPLPNLGEALLGAQSLGDRKLGTGQMPPETSTSPSSTGHGDRERSRTLERR